MNLENHEYANLFPEICGTEFEELKEDITKQGLLEPIWLYEGKILDGRNRYRACVESGVEYSTKEYEGNNPLGFVISLNLKRRHLNESQRAMVAAKLANMRQGERSDLSPSANLQKVNQAKAGEMLNVSERSVNKAKKVEQNGASDLVDLVESGKVSVSAASQVSELPKEEQEEIVQEIKDHPEVKPVDIVKKHVHVSNNSGNNEWYTPKEYIEAAKEVMGRIDLDPASSCIANKTVQAERYFTTDDDGLSKTWHGNIWLNPPYAQPLISKFCEKLSDSDIDQAVVLVNNATETKWFLTLADRASSICFPSSRIKFLDPDGKPSGAPLQGQAILYIGDNVKLFANTFSKFGKVVFCEQFSDAA